MGTLDVPLSVARVVELSAADPTGKWTCRQVSVCLYGTSGTDCSSPSQCVFMGFLYREVSVPLGEIEYRAKSVCVSLRDITSRTDETS